MAYVGTPQFRGSDIETLASILQGEAAGEGLRGLQAVASVIQNRAKQNFSGYGSSLLDQALARNQFQGQSSRIGPEAKAVAEQLVSGKLSDPTGGALYYANPGASTASWARRLNTDNALKIGNHYFTNNAKGEPFSGGASLPGKVGGDGMVARSFDPQVAAQTNTPTFGSMMPSMPGGGGGFQPPVGPPPGVSEFAFADEEKKDNRFEKAGKHFSNAMNAYPAPRPSQFPGGPSAEQSGALLKLTQDPQALARMMMQRRMG